MVSKLLLKSLLFYVFCFSSHPDPAWVMTGWVLHVFLTQLFCFFSLLFLYFSFSCYPRFLVVIPLLPLMSYILCHKYCFSLLVYLNPGPSESQVIHTLAVNVKCEYQTLKVLCSGVGTRANPRLLDTSIAVQDEEYTAAQLPSALSMFICFKRHKLLGSWNGRTAVTYKERKIFASCAD